MLTVAILAEAIGLTLALRRNRDAVAFFDTDDIRVIVSLEEVRDRQADIAGELEQQVIY